MSDGNEQFMQEDGPVRLRALPAEAKELAYSILEQRVQAGQTYQASDLSDEIRQATGFRINYQSIADWAKYHVPEAAVSQKRRKSDDELSDEEETLLEKEMRRLKEAHEFREIQASLREGAKVEAYKRVIAQHLAPYSPTPMQPILVRDDSEGKPIHKWVIVLSDWHVGQKTPKQDTDYVYEQNYEVTKWQVDRLLTALKSIHDVEVEGKVISDVLVLVLGDIVENDAMRKAQIRHSEFAVTEQTVKAFDLLNYFFRQLLTFPGLERLEAHIVGGNHDRTSGKPGLAGLGETDYIDTYAWLIGAMMERFMAEEPRIRIINHDSFFGRTVFGGKRIVFEHGASIKLSVGSYGGVPFYSIVNAARGYAAMLDGADMVIIGHLHQGALLPNGKGGWIALNGALPATTQYVQTSFKAVREPMQWLMDIHEEHGLVATRPLYAVPPTYPREGEAWTRTESEVAGLWR